MKILWLENWRRAARYNKWLHIDFVKEVAKHANLYLYGPRLEECFIGQVPLLYEEDMPFKEIVEILGVDVIVMHTKDAMFTDYYPKLLFGEVQQKSWLPKDFADIGIPKVCLEVDYHYEKDDMWYQKMGVDLILQRHYSQSLRRQTVPMGWLPFSVNPEIIKPNLEKIRNRKICFAGSLRSNKRNTYRYRKMACEILSRSNLIDVFSHKEKVGVRYVSCLQDYVSHLSSGSMFDLTSGKNFEIMASGSVLLTNKFSGMEKLFPPNTYCLYKNDCSDITRKAERIIRDDSYREQIAQEGRKCILKKHTNNIRAKEFISILEKL